MASQAQEIGPREAGWAESSPSSAKKGLSAFAWQLTLRSKVGEVLGKAHDLDSGSLRSGVEPSRYQACTRFPGRGLERWAFRSKQWIFGASKGFPCSDPKLQDFCSSLCSGAPQGCVS